MYEGKTPTSNCLQPSVLAVESSFDLDEKQRERTLYRLDGGAGTEPNMLWLLQRGYQLVAKGFSGPRARSLAAKVIRWDLYGPDAFVGNVDISSPSGRFVQVVVKKWLNKEKWQFSYYVSTLKLPSKQALLHYRTYAKQGFSKVLCEVPDRTGKRWKADKSKEVMPESHRHLLKKKVHLRSAYRSAFRLHTVSALHPIHRVDLGCYPSFV